MQCPHCGFVMLPLDKECARCRSMGRTAPSGTNSVNPFAAPPPVLNGDGASVVKPVPTLNETIFPTAQSAATPLSSYPSPDEARQFPPPSTSPFPSLPTTPAPASPPRFKNRNNVTGFSTLGLVSLILYLIRVAYWTYYYQDIHNRQPTVVVLPSAPSSPVIVQPPSGYPYSTPQVSASAPNPAVQQMNQAAQQAAQNAQQMQAANMQRIQQMQQMQAANMQRIQQMQSRMRGGVGPRFGGMAPGRPGF